MRARPEHRAIAALVKVDQRHEERVESVPRAQPREPVVKLARVCVEGLRRRAGSGEDGSRIEHLGTGGQWQVARPHGVAVVGVRRLPVHFLNNIRCDLHRLVHSTRPGRRTS